mmetsp:Transcript_3155/g.494  ORF Transcript_3155/g.494 Transcript_3155/m.494 type:complete len:111 (+) Transcript_3155:83-415(+)
MSFPFLSTIMAKIKSALTDHSFAPSNSHIFDINITFLAHLKLILLHHAFYLRYLCFAALLSWVAIIPTLQAIRFAAFNAFYIDIDIFFFTFFFHFFIFLVITGILTSITY